MIEGWQLDLCVEYKAADGAGRSAQGRHDGGLEEADSHGSVFARLRREKGAIPDASTRQPCEFATPDINVQMIEAGMRNVGFGKSLSFALLSQRRIPPQCLLY